MPSSDFPEVSLENSRSIPADIKDLQARLNTSRSLTQDEIVDYAAENVKISKMQDSKMRRWLKSPLVAINYDLEFADDLIERANAFPIGKVIPDIVSTIDEVDVTLMIAPTGAGKSITAPILSELLAHPRETIVASRGYRKTLHVGPSVEHCASTTRAFEKLFRHSGIEVSAFLNPEKEMRACDIHGRIKLAACRNRAAPAEFAYTTYYAAVQELPHAKLNLLILDEVHETNDNIQVAVAMARKMLLGRSFPSMLDRVATTQKGTRTLNKLLLMTATMSEKERKRYEKYFTKKGRLSFKILDLSDLNRKNKLYMSCLPGALIPHDFLVTKMASQIYKVLSWTFMLEQPLDPEYIISRMISSLECMMGQATDNLRRILKGRRRRGRRGDDFMLSIIVILPGMEQVDKMYSATFKLPNFNFDYQPGFHPVRQTSLVKDDLSITSECTMRGKWGGNRGRIVLTTNFVAAGLTVPNAAFVLDMGLRNIPAEYTRNGLRSLETTWIDKMQIIQRAGRTGRTTDGEYFLPYSGAKVDEMLKTDHGDLLRNRNFEERHLLLAMHYDLKLLHQPSDRLVLELKTSAKIRGNYSNSKFSDDHILMHSMFNMLSPEQARLIVQGTQLGIAAHVVYFVAHEKSRIKFCHSGTVTRGKNNGPSLHKSALDLYIDAMDGLNIDCKLPEKYLGEGDSIALADLLVSFYSQSNVKYLAARGIYNNFWAGNRENEFNSFTFADLYASFVREEGDDAVTRYADEIEFALVRAGIMSCHVFDTQVNRHIVSEGNYCLDENGRALLLSLLTMHSSRVGKMEWKEEIIEDDEQTVYKIYHEKPSEIELLCPESRLAHPFQIRGNKMYGRYTETFERRKKPTGLIDPITLKQLAFFLNINGLVRFRSTKNASLITFALNGSPGKSGIKIRTDQSTFEDVSSSRTTLARGLKVLTTHPCAKFTKNLEQYIIKLWRECEKTEEGPLVRPLLRSSHYGRNWNFRSSYFLYPRGDRECYMVEDEYCNARPVTLPELKDREDGISQNARPATLQELKDREFSNFGRSAGSTESDVGRREKEEEGALSVLMNVD